VAERRRSKEELDQEWSELVEEHRLAMPGTQVLFAFLLVLPFQRRFEELTQKQVYVYFSALICAAIAIVLLITPTANHRLRWRQQDKDALLVFATKTAIAATVFLAAGMAASVFLITDFLFGEPATALVTAPLGALFIIFWYGLPLFRRWRARARP
jgi:cation transport ATPase